MTLRRQKACILDGRHRRLSRRVGKGGRGGSTGGEGLAVRATAQGVHSDASAAAMPRQQHSLCTAGSSTVRPIDITRTGGTARRPKGALGRGGGGRLATAVAQLSRSARATSPNGAAGGEEGPAKQRCFQTACGEEGVDESS